MTVIEPVLHIKQIMAIFGVSQPTIYRWLAEARAGKSLFPLPLNGLKRKLMWNATDIEQYMHSRSAPQVPVVSNSKQERRAAKELRARNESAQKALAERHGIFLNSNDKK